MNFMTKIDDRILKFYQYIVDSTFISGTRYMTWISNVYPVFSTLILMLNYNANGSIFMLVFGIAVSLYVCKFLIDHAKNPELVRAFASPKLIRNVLIVIDSLNILLINEFSDIIRVSGGVLLISYFYFVDTTNPPVRKVKENSFNSQPLLA